MDLLKEISRAGKSSELQDEVRRKALIRRRLFPDSEPVKIGRFELEVRLGAGTMGTVYRGRDPQLERAVAIKVLREHSSGTSHRLLQEARGLARLTHPNVVMVFEVGEVEEQFYVAMEYVEGQTLAQWQVDREWRQCLPAYLEAGKGLSAVHEAGLVHRDFKPANVLMGDDGRVRVVDFGLVRSEARDDCAELQPGTGSLNLTAGGGLVGTPSYMSPEQLVGGQATPLSDQFSFCVSVYEALTGVRPYRGESLEELIEAMRTPVTIERGQFPSWLSAALTRGLSPEPSERFASMERLLEHLSPPKRRGASWLLVGAAAAAILALGAIAWAVFFPQSMMPSATTIATSPASRQSVLPGDRDLEALIEEDPTTAALRINEMPQGGAWSYWARRVLALPVKERVYNSPRFIEEIRILRDGRIEGRGVGSGFFRQVGDRLEEVEDDWMRWSTSSVRGGDGAQAASLIEKARELLGDPRSAQFLPDGSLRWMTNEAITEFKGDEKRSVSLLSQGRPIWGHFAPSGEVLVLFEDRTIRRLPSFDSTWSIIARKCHFGINGSRVLIRKNDSVVVWVDGNWKALEGSDDFSMGALSPDGGWVVGFKPGQRSAFAWRVDGEDKRIEITGRWKHISPVFLDKTKVALFSTAGSTILDLVSGRRVELPGSEIIQGASDRPDRLVVATLRGDVVVWNLSGMQGERVGDDTGGVWLGWTDPSSGLMTTAGADVRVVDLRQRRVVRVLGGKQQTFFFNARISPDGRLIAATARNGSASIWELDSEGDDPVIVSGHEAWPYALEFSPDSKWLVTGDRGGVVRQWPIDGGEPSVLARHPKYSSTTIHTLAYDRQGKYVVSASQNGYLLAFSFEEGEGRLLPKQDFNPVVLHDAAGRLLSVDNGGVLKEWSADGSLLRESPLHPSPVGYDFSSSRDLIALSTADREVGVWHRDDLSRPLFQLTPGDAMSEAVAFDEAGKRLAVGDNEGRIRVVDMRGAELWSFSGHSEAVRHLTFVGPDLVSASRDGSIRRWALPTTEAGLRALIVQRSRICLTPGERRKFLSERKVVALANSRACEERLPKE